MKEIQLTQGKTALVDDDDYEYLNQWNWHLFIPKNSRTMYAARTVKKFLSRTTILMHRQIKNAGSLEVDHINGNGLDNKKSNLRLCTRQQNSRNVSKKNKTGYKGVHKSGNKFIAQIWINKKCIHLGTFETDTQAAIAYNEKASELFGEFANLN